MGVSQSQSVLDFLPSAGSNATKRHQSSAQHTIFDVALKSASATVAQASDSSQLQEQTKPKENIEPKGKAVPQNGKDIPDSQPSDTPRLNDAPEKNAKISEESASDSLGTFGRDRSQSEQLASESGDAETAEASQASDEAVSHEGGGNSDLQDQSGESSSEGVEVQEADSEADALSGGDELTATELQLSESLAQLFNDLEAGTVSGEEFQVRFEAILQSQDVSLDDLKSFLEGAGLTSSAEFEQLIADPNAFIKQLKTMVQDNAELSDQLKTLVGSTVYAQLFPDPKIQSSAAPTSTSFVDVLKSEAAASNQAGSLVSQLLQERGNGKEAETGFDRDKLFEQLLAQKNTENPSKISGFSAAALKDVSLAIGGGNGISSANAQPLTAGEALSAITNRAASQGAAQSLPQLPVLRGLPGQQGATEALNERIMMMRSKGIQTAEIRLDPPELGALEVRVRVVGDSTSIQFHSPNPSVREALEAQINRLREMMGEAGVNLGNVDVSDQSLSERDEAFASHSGDDAGDEVDMSADGGQISPGLANSLGSAVGVVDYFA